MATNPNQNALVNALTGTPAGSALAFITGNGQPADSGPVQLTPQEIASRQQVAQAMLQGGMDYSPIQSPWQGLARVAQGVLGGYERTQDEKQQAAAMQAGAQQMAGLYQGLFGGSGAQGGTIAGAQQAAIAAPQGGASTPQTASSDLAPQQRALLDTIAGTESPGYNTLYGGQTFNNYAAHPDVAVPITSGPNAGKTSSAAGRYQFISPTWNAEAQKLGLTDFSPQSQDKAAWDLANTTYAQKTGRDLASDLNDPAQLGNIGSALSGEWTSLPGGIEAGTNQNRFAQAFTQNLGQYGAPVAANTGANSPLQPPGVGAVPPQAQAANVPGPQAPPNQVASADPNFVPPMPPPQQQAVPLPPIDPRTADAAQTPALPPQGTPPQASSPPQAALPPEAAAYASQDAANAANGLGTAGQAATAMPPQSGAPAVAAAIAGAGPSPALPQPSNLSPGGQQVAQAMAAGAPPGAAPAPAPNLSPQGQQVAQAMMPQAQQGMPGLDMSKVAAIMANPWIAPEQKQMLNSVIMSRLQPHKLIPVQTQNGTMLVDEMTGQPRQMFQTPNYQKVTGVDGAEHVYNMNDPQQAQLAAGMGQSSAGSLLPGQKSVQQMFPGMKPTTDQENYAGYYNQEIAKGVDPSKIEDIKQYEMEKKAPLVQMGQETAYNQTRGKALGEAVNSYMTGGQNAYKELQALNTIDDALAAGKGHIFTGPGSEAALNVKQAIGNLFGVNPEGTGASEIINKTGAQLASAAAKNLASRPTQFDFATFLKNNPGLDISPQGNAFMINIMKQQAQHEIDLGNLATHYRGDGSDWQDQVDNYYQSHPFMSPITGQALDAKQTLFPAPEGAPQGAAQPAAPPAQAAPIGPVPPAAVQYLKGSPTPEMRQYFDQKYGVGAAARALGEQP